MPTIKISRAQSEGESLTSGLPAKTQNKVPLEVTGYSLGFDFTEAFRDAMSKLTPVSQILPDVGRPIRVTAIGTVLGGNMVPRGLYVTITDQIGGGRGMQPGAL